MLAAPGQQLPVAEPLACCELEVLRLLAARKFDQRTPRPGGARTVKEHVTHVLGKLGTTAGTGPRSWALVP